MSNSEQETPNSEVTYTYDSLGRLVNEQRTAGFQPAQSTSYSYDLAGNRLSKTLNSTTINYQLGLGNRLASSSTASNSSCFISGTANEPIGTDNRWGTLSVSNLSTGASVVPGVNGCSFYAQIPTIGNATNTIVAAIRDMAGNMGYATNGVFVDAAEGTQASATYEYDAAGCLTNLNGVTLEWDERYRLNSVDDASSFVAYEYDVLGRRTTRIENGATNFFI